MRFLFLFFLMVLPFCLLGQIEVNGVVIDEENYPLIGTNIKIKNPLKGTITDINGEFEITIPGLGDTLIFSYIGYESQEVAINDTLPKQIFLSETSKITYPI